MLAPVLAQFLSPAVSPLFRALGLDPSLFSGLLLANDSGGAALAPRLLHLQCKHVNKRA